MDACLDHLHLFWRSTIVVSAFSQGVVQHSIVRFSTDLSSPSALSFRVRFSFLRHLAEDVWKVPLQFTLGTCCFLDKKSFARTLFEGFALVLEKCTC